MDNETPPLRQAPSAQPAPERKLTSLPRRWLSRIWDAGGTTHSEALRSLSLAAVMAAAYLLFGHYALPLAQPLRFLAGETIEFDAVLRSFTLQRKPPPGTLPVTLINMDIGNVDVWGNAAITPRDRLAQLLLATSRHDPAAIVVDIDLPAPRPPEAVSAAEQQLISTMQTYSAATPIVFVRKVVQEERTNRRMSAAHLLDAVAMQNSRLSFAHAWFNTDSDGVVRRWSSAISVCAKGARRSIAAVPVQLSAVMPQLPANMTRPAAAPIASDCIGSEESVTHLVVLGPRLIGESSKHVAAGVPRIPATQLLQPDKVFDDASVFQGRVVLIGNFNSLAGDQWRTASGTMSGAELIANVVRFSPLQIATEGDKWRGKVVAALLFVLICWLDYQLRLGFMLLCGTLLVVGATRWALAGWGWLGIFDAIDEGLLLFIQYKAVIEVVGFAAEWRHHRFKAFRSRRFWYAPVFAALTCVAVTAFTAHSAFATTATVVSSGAAAQQDADAVGIVADYQPVLLTLQRGEDKIPLKIGMLVRAGDAVALPSTALLIVSLANGQELRFTGPGTYAVPAGDFLGDLAAFFRSLTSFADAEHRVSGTATTRGRCNNAAGVEETTLPFPANGVMVKAGRADLVFDWTGGCGPYEVSIKRAGRIVGSLRANRPRASFADIVLGVGVYRIAVRGSGGETASARLTVRANAPQAPPALRAPTTPQGRIALALWIANQDHTAWRLEGYRSLLPLIKSGDALARMLGDAALDTGEQQLFVSGAGNP